MSGQLKYDNIHEDLLKLFNMMAHTNPWTQPYTPQLIDWVGLGAYSVKKLQKVEDIFILMTVHKINWKKKISKKNSISDQHVIIATKLQK